jgi:hypothetical protein
MNAVRPPSPDVLMERLDNLGRQVDQFRSETGSKMEQFRTETGMRLDRIDDDITRNYVSREEFTPVKTIVYGMAGLILIGFVGMLMYLIGWQR